jgi:hypothetical protein
VVTQQFVAGTVHPNLCHLDGLNIFTYWVS